MDDTAEHPQERDMKEMQAELSRLTKLVYYDDLTGLLNRRGFNEQAGRAFPIFSHGNINTERRAALQIPFSIIFLDIDNFKSLNDTHGHAAGDAALKTVAEILQSQLRAGDLQGRMGGEEFVATIIGADAQSASTIAEKLRLLLEQTQFEWEGVRIPLTASFGVAEYTTEQTLHELIGKADRAMYQAKRAGKNRVFVSTER